MKLLRVARNAVDLQRTIAFYEALGFQVDSEISENAALAVCLGVDHVQRVLMRLGEQVLELTQCYPAGKVYPVGGAANDLIFQHIAIVTDDIKTASARALAAGGKAISQGGPQLLPKSSGGMRAFKFRDLDGHPVEFLEWTDRAAGYDHSAISVSNPAQSIAFYAALGFAQTARQVNSGPEQENLDGLAGVAVDVVTLKAGAGAPHLELLAYQKPPGRAGEMAFNDIAADRLVIRSTGGALSIWRDPDGHPILFDNC
jgi:catechol 2,3-dioxygenase-like lactoylglutathione lyase family enzyme